MSKPSECTREELLVKLIELDVDPGHMMWFIDWARRREGQRADSFADALKTVIEVECIGNAWTIASDALSEFGDL